jgi:hypothetical protein
MTTWRDWRSWTFVIIGQDVASAGRILDLDFSAGRVTYNRETGNRHDQNPHPYGTEEYRRYLYDTIEGKYDHVWVDPNKSVVLGRDEYQAVMARKKPSSFIELIDIDPRDYFGGEVTVTSTHAPHLLSLALPLGALVQSDRAVSESIDGHRALTEYQQLQRDINEGLYTLREGVERSIWLLGAVQDIGAAWAELNPWIAIEVRSILRSTLAEQKAGKPVSDVSPDFAAALLRVSAWAEQKGALSQDRAFEFMNQPPADILEYVHLHLGQELPDPGMSWHGVADDAVYKSNESADASVWLTIGIEVYEWLASRKPEPDHCEDKTSAMYARAHRSRLPGTSPADRELDRKAILEWFFSNESMAPSKAAICPRDWYKQSTVERKEQRRITKKLHVIKMLYESGQPLPDRLAEWLALLPYLRLV